MANLTDSERTEAARAFVHQVYVLFNQRADCHSGQIKAAIDATDDWIEANQAAYVAALPAAFRNGSTAAQKAQLFCFVALKRAGLL